MTVATVGGDRPQWIAGVYSNPFLVRNSGDATVYLGQDSSLSIASRAITLGPGATLNWQGKTELWALADPGTTGELEWLYDADSSFTPGPTTVGIDGIVDTNIVGAVTIAGTTQTLYRGSVTVGPSAFVPAYNDGTAMVNILTLPGDVQTLSVSGTIDNFAPASSQVVQTGYLYVVWFERISNVYTQVLTEVVSLAYGFTAFQMIRRKASYVSIYACYPQAQPYGGNMRFSATVVGIGASLPESYRAACMIPLNTGFVINTASIPSFGLNYSGQDLNTQAAGTTKYITISSMSGPCTVSIRSGTIAAGGTINVSLRAVEPESFPIGANFGMAFTESGIASNAQLTRECTLPDVPVQLIVQRNGAAAGTDINFAVNITTART